jgi:hypothetical protein
MMNMKSRMDQRRTCSPCWLNPGGHAMKVVLGQIEKQVHEG